MRDQRAFHFRGADAVAADVDHVVDAAGDPVVAVLVAPAAVAGEIRAGIGPEIGVDEARVIAVDGAHLARPGIEQHEVALGRAFEHDAVGIDDGRLHAEEAAGGRTGFLRYRAGSGDQDAAGFGLPPGIDDRTTAFAHHAVIPLPGFGIDRLADGAEQADRIASRLFHRRLAFAHQRADRGGRGVEDRDLVLVAHLPEAARVRIIRHALEHHRWSRRCERSVQHIAVAGHPAHVGGAPEHVVLAQVEHAFVGVAHPDQHSRRWCAARPSACRCCPRCRG
jgi:hypothetical protein